MYFSVSLLSLSALRVKKFSFCLIEISLVATCPSTVGLQEEPGSIFSTYYTPVGSGRQHTGAHLLLGGLHKVPSTFVDAILALDTAFQVELAW